jgi:hypothetical protein
LVLCQAYFEYSRENASPNSPGKIIYANKNPGFSVAGKPGNPTALSSHPHWCGFCCCNCLFTTLVTRVGYLLLHYSTLIDACRTRKVDPGRFELPCHTHFNPISTIPLLCRIYIVIIIVIITYNPSIAFILASILLCVNFIIWFFWKWLGRKRHFFPKYSIVWL